MQPRYLTEDIDRRTTVAGMRAARAIAHSEPMCLFVRREVSPDPDADDDEALLEFACNNGATIFHPSCTCKMGSDGSRSSMHGCACMESLVARSRLLDHAGAGQRQHERPRDDDRQKAVDMIRADAASR